MLRLGFDIDEVVTKTCSWVVDYLYSEFSIDLDLNTVKTFSLFDHELYKDNKYAFESLFKEFDKASYITELEPHVGGVSTLNNLHSKGHKLFFISHRPKNTEYLTAKWMRQHSIPFNKIIHLGFEDDKGKICRELRIDSYVDDRIDDINSVLKHKGMFLKKGIYLFDKPWNSNYINSNVNRVHNWKEIYKNITGGLYV